MAYARYVPGAGQVSRPQQIAQQPSRGIASQSNQDTLSKTGEWRQKAQDAATNGKPLSYFELQEGNAKAFDTYKRDLNWNSTDEIDMAKAMDGIVKKTAADQIEEDRQTGGGGANFNWRAVANNLQSQDGLGFTRATEGGGRAVFADGNQQREFLARADAAGAPVSGELRRKGGLMADMWDQQDQISGGDVQSRTGWFNPISGYMGSGGKSMGMGAGSGTGSPNWVVPGLADSDNPVSGGSTGAPQSQGEQRQYEDLLNKQRHDPTIFQDFNRESMSADLQKSYKKFAPTNMGAADNYNPMPPQGIMSPATGGPAGAPGQLAQQPSVFTNPMQRWTNEDGSRELKFDSNGMASGEDGRYTPASGLYMKGRPENGGKRYSSVNEYAADKGLGIKDGTDPRRDYGLGQTGAGAGPIASATYGSGSWPAPGDSNTQYSVGENGKLTPIARQPDLNTYDGWMRATHQGEYNTHQGRNGEQLSYPQKQRDYELLAASKSDQDRATQGIRQMPGLSSYDPELGTAAALKQQHQKILADSNSTFTGSYSGGSGEGRAQAKKMGPLDVIRDTFKGSGQSWKPAPAPSPVPKGTPGVPNSAPPEPSPVPSGTPGIPGSAPEPSPVPKGIPGVPNSGTGDGIKADSQLGDAPKQKKGLLDVLGEPLKGVVDSYKRMPNEKVDALLEKYGHDQIETSHMGLAAKRKMLQHLEKTGVAQKPEGILATPGGEIMGAPSSPADDVFKHDQWNDHREVDKGQAMRFVHRMDGDLSEAPKGWDRTPNHINRSAINPANDVFERQNDVADHGNYDGRAMSMDRSGMLEGRMNAQMGASSVPHTPVDGWKLSAEQIKKAQPAKGPAPKDGWMVKAPRPDAKPGNYRTELPPAQEKQFAAWVKKTGAQFDPSSNNPKEDYDMRGFYKAVQAGDPAAITAMSGYDGKPHYPDTYKTPYHETFSDESKWAVKGKAPHWQGDKLMSPSGQVLKDETPQKVSPVTRGFQKLSQMNPAAAELFRRAYAARH